MAGNVLGHQSLLGQLTLAESIKLTDDCSQTGDGAVKLRDAVSRSIRRVLPKVGRNVSRYCFVIELNGAFLLPLTHAPAWGHSEIDFAAFRDTAGTDSSSVS